MSAVSRPVLILDDDRELLELLRRAVEATGRRVRTAPDSTRALEVCGEEEPGLIIADLMLPHVDGEAFLEQYRRRWPRSSAPVVLLTASAQREKVARRMRVDAALGKPFSLDELRAVVEGLLSEEQRAGTQPERHRGKGE
ncbi:MAG: response regulator [Myxococcota bacterium]